MKSTADTFAFLQRMLKAFGRRVAEEDPISLPMLVTLSKQLDGLLASAVYRMRDAGHTDTDIAVALGVTRAAVSKRWPGGGRYKGAAGRYR